ncbi:MAG: DNA primase [bacterium]
MGRIPDDVVDQVREGIPIENVIGEYVALRRAGSAFKGLCPFHEEKTPSFTVNPRMNIFKCFGCNVGGNVFHFLMRHEGLSFREAIELLAKRQGIDLSRYEGGESAPPSARQKIRAINRFAAGFYRAAVNRPEGKRARAYLRERGISSEAGEAFRIGCAPASWDALLSAGRQAGHSPADLAEAGLAVTREDGTGHYDRFRDRVIFPILDLEGEVAGFGGRSLPDSDSRHATAKYINSPDTAVFRKGRILYGLPQAREGIRAGNRALVTEGYFDVISLWQAGFRSAVAPLGTALTAEHIRALRAHAEEIVFVFDPDSAGQAASERAGALAGRMMGLAGAPDRLVAGEVLKKDFIGREGLGAVGLRVMDLPGGRDVDELLRAEGPEAFGRLLEETEGLLERTVRVALGEVGPGAAQSEKMAALRRLLPVLGACHPSVRDQYFSLVESRIGIPYPTLAAMVKRMREEERPAGARPAPVVELLGGAAERPRQEVDLVRTLIARPELGARPELTAVSFADSAVREIVGALREAAAGGEPLGPAALAGRLADPAAQALVAELAAEELSPAEAEEEFFDCLERIGERQRRRREEAIVRNLEEARRREGDDSPAVRRLLEEKNALLRARQKLAAPR